MRIKLIVVLCFFVGLVEAQDLPYVNWENHPVHALDLSPDKTRLAVAHTADNRVQLFDVSLGYPIRLGHVKVGIDPVSVRFKNNNELWVVNHISDSITLVDFDNRQVKQTLITNDEPFDVVFAQDKAFVSCSQVNQIMVFDTTDLTAVAQVIDVMAEDPRAMAVNADGSKVYVASFESGNKTTILAGGIDETDGRLGFPGNPVNRNPSPYQGQNPPPNNGTGFFPAFNPDLPEPPKVSLIVRQDDTGRWRDDNGEDWTHMVSGEQANLSGRVQGWTLLDHDITVIDTQTHEVSYVSGLMNIGMAIGFNVAKNQITLIGTDATNEIRYEPNLNGTFVRVKLGVVSANNLSQPMVMDLNPHLNYSHSTIAQTERDKSVGDPRGIVWSEDGNTGYVSGMGSNNVIVVDALGNRKGRIEAGQGVTGLALDESHKRLYAWNHFEASLSVIDTQSQLELKKVQVFNPLPQAIVDGRKFLYSTHDTSGLGQASCASCHVDARMDKLAWDLGNPAGEMKIFNQNCQTDFSAVSNFNCENFHPMKGPMMTQTFQDIIGHEPFHWRGDRDGVEEFNGAFMSINGDDTQLLSQEMAQFKAMLSTITFPPNAYRNIDNSLPESIELTHHYTSGRFSDAGLPLGFGNPQHGLELFNLGLLDNVFQCGSCHTIPTGMAVNGGLKLGVINASVGGEVMPLGPFDANHLGIVSVDGSTQKSIKTPQLRNLYEKVGFEMSRTESLAGFGFLHDGAIDSVSRFLSAPAFGVDSDQEVADLVALMMAFSGSELDNGHIPLGNTPDQSQDTHAGVGQQFALTQATQSNARVDELVAIAMSAKVDLIVNASDGRNYLFNVADNQFINEDGDAISAIGLMSIPTPINTLTYTLVPKGLGRRLAFDRDGDGISDKEEIAQGSNPTDAHSTQIRPKTGLWFNPQRSGHGIDLHFSGNNLFMIWYTYNDDKTPTWYIASGEYQANWQADLLTFSWDEVTRTPTSAVIGQVNLNFLDAKNSEFSWIINGREVSEPFVYLNVSNQPTTKQFTGSFYNPDDSGWGISVNSKGDAIVMIVYYYDENGMPRWALGSGINIESGQMDLLSYSGFCPDCDFSVTTTQLAGLINYDFSSPSHLSTNIDITYPDNQVGKWLLINQNLQAISSEFFDPEMQ